MNAPFVILSQFLGFSKIFAQPILAKVARVLAITDRFLSNSDCSLDVSPNLRKVALERKQGM